LEDERAIYPGTCRSGIPADRRARAIRARVDDTAIAFEDRLQGKIEQTWLPKSAIS